MARAGKIGHAKRKDKLLFGLLGGGRGICFVTAEEWRMGAERGRVKWAEDQTDRIGKGKGKRMR